MKIPESKYHCKLLITDNAVNYLATTAIPTEMVAQTPGPRKKGSPRESFTPVRKLEVLAAFNKTNDIRITIQQCFPRLREEQYDSRRKLILSWKRDEPKIKELATKPRVARLKKQRPRGIATTLTRDEELSLVTWINRLRGEGVPVSSVMLARKAIKIAKNAGKTTFIASQPWQKRFRARHRLAMRAKTRQGQIRPQDAQARAVAFGKKVQDKMKELGVSIVYNADQTAVFFEFIPKKTVDLVGAKTVWVRCGTGTKTRATVMLLADSQGGKRTPTVVLKTTPSKVPHVAAENLKSRHGFGIRVFEKIKKIQQTTGMKVYGNKSGWWNEDIHKLFLKQHFGERENPETPVLLLLDEFSGHWTQAVRDYASTINVHLMKVPAGLTSVCQPADVAWMKPFKDLIRSRWVDTLMDQLDRHDSSINQADRQVPEADHHVPEADCPVPAAPFKFVMPQVEEVCGWIISAWDELSTRSIRSGFERTHIQERCTAVVERLEQHAIVVEEVDSEDEFDA